MTTEPAPRLAQLLSSMTPDSILETARRTIREAFTRSNLVIDDNGTTVADGVTACVTLRVEGTVRGCWLASARSLEGAVALATIKALVDPRYGGALCGGEVPSTHVEVWIEIAREEITQVDCDQLWGTHGLEVQSPGRQAFFLPSVPIELQIADADDLLERAFAKARMSKDDRASARLFKTSWVHVAETRARTKGKQRVAKYDRLRPVAAKTNGSLDLVQLGLSAGTHLLGRQRSDGSYSCSFDPIKGLRDDARSEPARLIGCTLALARLAAACSALGTPAAMNFRNGALKGIAWVAYHLTEQDGAIVFGPSSQSTALECAACALLACGTLEEKGCDQSLVRGLVRTILGAQRDDGSFAEDLKATDRDGPAHVASGQALLALALQKQVGLDNLMPCFDRALAHSSRSDTAQATPSLLAWQAKAWCELGHRTRDSRFANAAYAMLDRLLPRQMCAGRPDDFAGGYQVEPNRPPSVLTALFTEAMVMGWKLAVARGDRHNADEYLAAACAGLRFLDRLVITEEQEFLFRKPELAIGGVRRDLASFDLRCDYTAHAVACIATALDAGLVTVDGPGSRAARATGF